MEIKARRPPGAGAGAGAGPAKGKLAGMLIIPVSSATASQDPSLRAVGRNTVQSCLWLGEEDWELLWTEVLT